MKYKVHLDIKDAYLKRKLELILRERQELCDRDGADIIFTDDINIKDERAHLVGRDDTCKLKVPFSDDEVLKLLPERGAGAHITAFSGKVFFGEREIKLTELERLLFMKLYERRGGFVSREELFSVFAEGASESMLNVYIHYLREKLELDGEKVILSSRKLGYRINEKFFS